MILDKITVEAMVFGGGFLGGGGGGSMEEGRRMGLLALEVGSPKLIPIDSLSPDAILVTVSAVGAPGAPEKFVKPVDFVEAVKVLSGLLGAKIAGFISSENGGISTANGLIQSAFLGIPLVDSPCNGRAHPTGIMGSMGLNRQPDFISKQAAIGGNPEKNRRISIYVEGNLAQADGLIRQAAVEAGGMIAVARNPIAASFVRENGAPGAISQAIELGRFIMADKSKPRSLAEKMAKRLSGGIITEGKVSFYQMETRGGYDVGKIEIGEFELTFWNEYMTLEKKGERIATFPDLMVTLDAEEGIPVSSSELARDRRVIVIHVPRHNLILGAGVKEKSNFSKVEEVVGKEMIRYLFQS
jgi:DUF917 family protein